MALDPSSILLTDRVAVVTGGGAGIGRGIAAGLTAFGAKVAIWERDPASCAAAAAEIGALGIPTDVRDSAAVDAALARTEAELGPVTILVNNAGGVFWSGILETTENGWDALYKSNLRRVYLCTQRVARRLVEQKLPGAVISVTSIEGVRAAPGYATYAAAKAGVINYTKTAALELAPHGIRVNALAPDITPTEGMMQIAPPGADVRFGLTVPMGRGGHVDEMAGAAVFLASEMSSYITGQTIHVDGGTQAAVDVHGGAGDVAVAPGHQIRGDRGDLLREPGAAQVAGLVKVVVDPGHHIDRIGRIQAVGGHSVTMRAQSAASVCAIAKPIPLLPPVTTAADPAKPRSTIFPSVGPTLRSEMSAIVSASTPRPRKQNRCTRSRRSLRLQPTSAHCRSTLDQTTP
jgi:3-oxoacyl-[acyl-carrier protein] reductase